MNPHATWFDFLPGYDNLRAFAHAHLSREWTWMAFQETHFSIAHVTGALVVVMILTVMALRYSDLVESGREQDRILPPRTFGVRAFLEMFLGAVLALAEQIMGRAEARRTLPLTATLAFFIFACNLIGLVPGMVPPTDTLKTNVALSVSVFLLYNFWGLRAHGWSYVKHFFGPVWYLAPLMLVIELISHLARPVSLALRLMGNMFADHKVLVVFLGLAPLLVPVPFLVLGLLVCVVQTLVFTLLTMVYISMAVAHEEHGEGHGREAAAHG